MKKHILGLAFAAALVAGQASAAELPAAGHFSPNTMILAPGARVGTTASANSDLHGRPPVFFLAALAAIAAAGAYIAIHDNHHHHHGNGGGTVSP